MATQGCRCFGTAKGPAIGGAALTRLADHEPSELWHAASRGALTYRTGPFVARITTRSRAPLHLLKFLYGETEILGSEAIAHFHIELHRVRGIRRWWKPQITFLVDGLPPFQPYPLDHGFPLLEWGLNWCIAMRSHQYLMLHAAVLARGSRALILPAMPGSGKSTLSAALGFRGWRFLSDEFGLIQPASGILLPLPRAVPLKNESIDVIRAFAPEAVLGPVFPKTRKGDVAHLRPPGDSLERQLEPAKPTWIVFPRFLRGHPGSLQEVPSSLAFVRLAHNAFNYRLLGLTGFRTLEALIRHCGCYSLDYGDLSTATAILRDLADNTATTTL